MFATMKGLSFKFHCKTGPRKTSRDNNIGNYVKSKKHSMDNISYTFYHIKISQL
jgi:hypothetical protein